VSAADHFAFPGRPVIVDIVRSPMGRGRHGGALESVHPVDLLADVLAQLAARTGIDPGSINDVMVGCVGQNLEQSATPGRQAVLAAGFPDHVPSVTIERKCGSGQQAVEFAHQSILTLVNEVVMAAGVESMSRVPMGSARGDADPFGPRVRERYPQLISQGVAAELVASKWKLTREELDEYSARSHQRAAGAAADGLFDSQLVPIRRPDGVLIAGDETIRPNTTADRLGTLSPAFASAEMRMSLPDIDWKVTAGNSSQISDGGAAALLLSERRAIDLGLRPRARVVATAVCGADPTLMLTAPIPATHEVLRRSGLTAADLDAVEVNEAFASVPLAWMREFPAVDDEKVNPWGGAIALGHPLGASGVRLLSSLIGYLEHTGGRYGLQVMCEAGGMANAMVVERLG
jgi:acetyl-CoA acyltransferase